MHGPWSCLGWGWRGSGRTILDQGRPDSEPHRIVTWARLKTAIANWERFMRARRLLGFVHAAALHAGAALAAPWTRAQALAAVAQPDATTRLVGVNRLAELGLTIDADRGLDRMGDSDPRVRVAAGNAIWQIRRRPGKPAIDKLFARGLEQMQTSALDDALARLGNVCSKADVLAWPGPASDCCKCRGIAATVRIASRRRFAKLGPARFQTDRMAAIRMLPSLTGTDSASTTLSPSRLYHRTPHSPCLRFGHDVAVAPARLGPDLPAAALVGWDSHPQINAS
jgi:hypothetical protein